MNKHIKRGIYYFKLWDVKNVKKQLMNAFGKCVWCGIKIDSLENAVVSHLVTSLMGREKEEVTPKILLCRHCSVERDNMQVTNYNTTKL